MPPSHQTSEHRPSRTFAWAATALAAALVLLWAASLRWVVRVPVPSGTVRLCYGAVDFFSPATEPFGFSVTRFPASPPVLFPSWGTLRGGPFVVFPLWIPAALFGLFGLWRFRRASRLPPGRCTACGYDLRGNESGRCPECGEAVRPAAV